LQAVEEIDLLQFLGAERSFKQLISLVRLSRNPGRAQPLDLFFDDLAGDSSSRRKRRHPRDRAVEIAEIPLPASFRRDRKLQEACARLAAEGYPGAVSARELVELIFEVRLDIFGPLTQTRQGEAPEIDARQQILAEPAFTHSSDVAALVAASIVRLNPQAQVLPFSDDVVSVSLDARAGVMANAAKLASLPSGGTNCSAPLRWLNKRKASGDLVIYVSDNESWVDVPQSARHGNGGTETMRQWSEFKRHNREARMVCIDIQPYGTTQAKERKDILNIGGFSDQVFDLIADFARGELNADHWVGVIEKIAL
jgi:hypothetical protein